MNKSHLLRMIGPMRKEVVLMKKARTLLRKLLGNYRRTYQVLTPDQTAVLNITS